MSISNYPILEGRLSKNDCVWLSNEWSSDPKVFKILIGELKSATQFIVYNVSWVFRTLATTNPELFEENFEEFFNLISFHKNHEGIIRNIIGVMQDIEIPVSFEGRVYDYCFRNINSKETPIAARVFSMSVCYKISELHKDLKPELKDTIASILESYGSTSGAIFSRGNKILKKLKL